jgi:glutathionylspermidine synthase
LRVVRFDFHFTSEGWRISEANSDVPGGFNEASGFTDLMARHYGELRTAADPTEALVRAIDRRVGKPGTVALVHATAYSDDRQVMAFLGRRLQRLGHTALLAAPDHLGWESGRAFVANGTSQIPVDLIFRFFPADWLAALPWRCDWRPLLGASLTPLCNPGLAIICQSKRFPLLWDELALDLPTWRALLPRTYDVRALPSGGQADLVFKPAFGRAGEMIGMPGLTPVPEMAKVLKSVRRYPKQWVAQERFDAIPLRSAIGDVFPCIGVYTLDGTAIGAYGRLADRPLVDQSARDAAILLPRGPVSTVVSSEVGGDHGRH